MLAVLVEALVVGTFEPPLNIQHIINIVIK